MNTRLISTRNTPQRRRLSPALIALVGVFGGIVSLSAQAQYLRAPGEAGFFYGGASVGQARMDTPNADVGSLLAPGVGLAAVTHDDKDTAYKLFGGYQMSRQLALEAGYFNLGSSRFDARTLPSGGLSGQTKVQGVNLDLVATLPLTERFSAQARIGAQHARSRSEFSATGAGGRAVGGAAGSRSDSGTQLKLGLGMQYEFSSALWIRAELERYRVKNFTGQRRNIDVASVSLVFPFGRSEPTPMAQAAPAYQPRPEPMPQPMAQPAPQAMPAPAPAPVVVQAPPPPAPAPAPVAPQRMSLSAETLFGFDAAQIRPEGRAALDNLGREIGQGRYQTISVEGHTDRLGSGVYNQALSQRRAESVRAYLVDQVRLDGSRITAKGLGETQPTTTPGACPDSMGRTRLITCLQADRRVYLEVTGTR